jgi:hypothetical protein
LKKGQTLEKSVKIHSYLLLPLDINFSPLAQVTQLTVTIGYSFSPLAQVTQLTVTIGYSFFTTCSSDSTYCYHWLFMFHQLLK